MKIKHLHEWDLPVDKAKSLQKHLSNQLHLKNQFSEIHILAGADIAIDVERNEGIAGIVLYTFPDLKVVERRESRKKISYPYIPGLLSFREAPILLDAIEKVKLNPDLFIFDGQGIAHPRGLGIASHLGLFLDKPTIGCAKSLLVGAYDPPDLKAGSLSPLFNAGKVIGAVVRTRDNVKPVFVSPGHKIDLETSVKIILKCCDGYRIPKPVREADRYVKDVKRSLGGEFLMATSPGILSF